MCPGWRARRASSEIDPTDIANVSGSHVSHHCLNIKRSSEKGKGEAGAKVMQSVCCRSVDSLGKLCTASPDDDVPLSAMDKDIPEP